MKETFSSVFSLVLATGLVELLLRPPVLPAATPCDPPVAQMVSVQGSVVVRRAGQTQSQPARLNETYCPGDRIQVGKKSRAEEHTSELQRLTNLVCPILPDQKNQHGEMTLKTTQL